MKILAINNYSLDECLKRTNNKTYPRQHLWGIDYLQKKGHKVTTELYQVPKCKFLPKKLIPIWAWIYQFYFCLKIVLKKEKYDIILSLAHPIVGFLPLMKKLRLINSKLFTLIHHHRKRFAFTRGWDYCFFLSEDILHLEKNIEKGGVIKWGPDIDFYEETYQRMKQNYNQRITNPRFISNGKTKRDLKLIDDACNELNIPLTIITDNYNSQYATVFKSGEANKNAISDEENLKLCSESLVCVIPIIKEQPDGILTGLTSVLDALALGMPLLISDNCNLGINIETLQLGKIYKAGNKEDFKRKAIELISNAEKIKQYSQNAREYAIQYSYLNFCKSLTKIIETKYNH